MITYTLDHSLRIFHATFAGRLSVEEIIAAQDKATRDPEFDPSYGQVIDLRNAQFSELGPDVVRRIAGRVIMNPGSRRAYVVDGDLGGLIARMYAVHAEVAGRGGVTELFTDIDAARAWLMDKPEPA